MLVGSIYYKLKKTCDCVNLLLLSTLEFDGIQGDLHALIRLYLSDRYRRELIKTKMLYHHTSSDWGRIKSSGFNT
jgi:hypothetical protein